ncbi:MAG: two pore domain potassium channel family protein [Chloroflexi bacterium]|nr:MAG: two pore domain potassium channel family protein [Chloroflexota bacterium]
MRILAVIFGIVLILLVALDAFETIILPRRVARRFRLVRLITFVIQLGWKSLGYVTRAGARRESILSYLGPLSLLALFGFWAVLFVFGFALLLWGLALPLNAPDKVISFTTYLYLSGTTFFTLGLGDITPLPGVARLLVVSEVALGFIFLALVISYVPIIYQAFSRRELRISLLDSRAGSPATAAELLRRNHAGKNVEELRLLLRDWEVWCADILESHLSYPILAYYRSQHDQQSWVEALTVILDTSALILTGIDGLADEPARFTFAMARHAVVDLALVIGIPPTTGVNRLSAAEFAHLRDVLAASGIHLREGTATEQKLAALRETYEPFVSALADRMLVSLPPWIPPENTLDDWQTTAWDDLFPSTRQTLLKVMHRG